MFKEGQEVYTIDWYSYSIRKAKIVSVDYREESIYVKFEYVENTVSIENIFVTEKEARDAKNKKIENTKNEYRKQINSVEDLVVFLFNHCINGDEYTDYEAREVAIEKAKEYGINLGD